MHYKILISLFTFLIISRTNAQDSSNTWKPEIQKNFFIDSYYAYDFNEPEQSIRQDFFYNHNRHNEFNINLALLEISANHDQYRAQLGVQFGNYATDNYAHEEALMQHLYEAYVGVALNQKRNLWLDAGIFSSHLGFENAVSMDNLTLSRSFTAESSPYYLAGVRLNYKANEKLTLLATINNGWQRIKRVEGNSFPSFGTQVSYQINSNNKINWSTFVGTEDPDSLRRIKYFNNLYLSFAKGQHWEGVIGYDFGLRFSKNQIDYWHTPIAILSYHKNKHRVSGRLEYFGDPNAVINPYRYVNLHYNPMETTSISINYDYSIFKNIIYRVELRYLHNQEKYYQRGNAFVKDNLTLMNALAVKF